MSTALQTHQAAEISRELEQVLIGGDLSRLTPEQSVSFYKATCESLGLNPLTKPFEYLTLNGKKLLYARKDCTDQLRSIRNVSVAITAREVVDGCYVVTAKATMPNGRTDESIGAVPLASSASDKANAMMKAETKARRRVTLSICGLGMLDDSEVETIPGAQRVSFDPQPAQITAAPVEKTEREIFIGSIKGRKSMMTAFEQMRDKFIVINPDQGYEMFSRILKKHLGHDSIESLPQGLKSEQVLAAADEMFTWVCAAEVFMNEDMKEDRG